MTVTCGKCGQATRTVYPYMTKALLPASAIADESRPLPRAALTPAQDAAIPWGEHPDDNAYGVMCRACTFP